MAELVVTMAIGPLVSMLRDKASSYLLDQYNVMEGMEKQHRILKRRLPIILDVIADAEEQATAHREGAKAWLQELKTVAYEAHGVFDEFKYEALRRRAKKNGHYKELGFSGIKLLTTHSRVVFRRRMGRKLSMILQDINVLIAEMHDFGLRQTLPVSKQLRQTPESKQWRLTDYVIIDPQDIARRSRDKEKKNVVDVLLGQASSPDLIVVPIVGMGGIGKTTLAQLIYNEPEVQKHFQLLLWVCVSDTFDVNSLAKSIIEASPKKNEDIDKPPLDRLQKLVSGQRYLLVLDDVWNREVHKWERLKVCLQHGGTGSAVLTTTRDKRVAEIMSADRTYHLNDLEDRFLKEIIEAKAFGSREKPAELVKMVPEIVERCSGSPLAATALGSILCTKTSVKEWEDVSSRISICTEESGIFPILMLAYKELPSHMKKCFAFCALFPKDYKIDVEKLIQLWIANGFISEQNAESLETIGKYIFNELASRSFFVDIVQSKTEWEYYSRTTCKIHDLMHDIAMSVMENQTIVATEESSHIDIERLPDTAQHLFLSREKRKGMFLSREETDGNSSEYVKKISPVIRTLICDTYTGGSLHRLSKYNSLHALKLHIGRESFLPKPRYLRYLRYLDLSGSFIKALPEDISILYNLQMLDLSNCLFRDRLPSQLKYMTSLRHLYTHGCPELKSMPPGLRKLTKLQTLTCFVVAVTGPDCSDVAELQHLNLGGQLELCQIENIDKEAEKKVSYLGNKEDLRELTLRWTFVCDSEVLNKFEPHNRLQVLRIHYYGGKCMGMLQNMVEIHLFHCERLQFLVRGNTSFIYPKLKHLTLEHLLNFERWWDINESQGEQIIFPQLEKLFIRYCGKLVSFLQEPCSGGGYRLVHTAFPALKVLEVNDLESFQRWDAAVEGEKILFPRLEKLYIKKCPKLIALPEACSGGDKLGRLEFPALKVLEMKDLESFQRWHVVVEGEQMSFPLLEKLSIQKCPKLIDLPEAPILGVLEIEDGAQEIFHWVERYMASLTNLKLNLKYTETLSEAKCTSIEPVESEEKRNQKCPIIFMELGCCNSFFRLGALEKWNYYEKLEDLHINRCDVLVHWPEQVFKSLVSLRRLAIRNCENLAGYAQAPLEPSTSRRSKHLPDLKVLDIHDCGSIVEMFNIPTSLKRMTICGCIKLESIFGKQQGTSELVEGFSCSEAITRTAISELASSPMNHFCPCLEYLYLSRCDSLSEVLNLPWSLKVITIDRCSDINVLSSQLVEIQKPSTAAAAAGGGGGEHSLPPRLESLTMLSCDSMIGILRLPTSLKRLNIQHCRGLTSLNIESELLPNEPPLLVSLWLDSCRNLAFLPNDPQVYHALERLRIKDCPAIKKLPRCLKQQLGSINSKELDACYEVTAFKPKTWKQIPRLVGQWRQSHCI